MRDYSKIYNIGHKAVADILKHRVLVEEKIDGSQFSFGQKEGKLWMRTHHQDVSNQEPFGLFSDAMTYVRKLHKENKLKDGYSYRGEVLQKPKHNLMTYERVPKNNIIIFDIDKGEEDYLEYVDKVSVANMLDLETVPYLFYGTIDSPETIKTFLDRRSILGSPYIEGMVFKAYGLKEDGKTVMAKYVAERFKEVRKETGIDNKEARTDVIKAIGLKYKTDARWYKAIQHLKDGGKLDMEPRDIPILRNEIMLDIEEECSQEIAKDLLDTFLKDILKVAVEGFPEFWKNYLMEKAFEGEKPPADPVRVDPLAELFPMEVGEGG